MRLEGKVAIVTGGASGMGLAIARLFAAEGAKVVIADVQDAAGEREAAAIGAAALFVHHDVTSEESWHALIAATAARFGPADVLVNNAGILMFTLLTDMTREDFDRLFAVNVTGVFLGIKTIGAAMVARGSGSIVNISSTGGFRATNSAGAYTASKFAVRGLTKTAALELGHKGVRVNSVHPGWINTPLVNPDGAPQSDLDARAKELPLQRVGHPEDIAEACLYLASDASTYCAGTELLVDGGHLAGRYQPFLPGAPRP